MPQKSELCCVFVDLDARKLKVVAVAAFPSEYAKELIEEADVVYRYREFNMAAVAWAAIQRAKAACCA